MKILLVIFKMRNMNKKNFELLTNSDFFQDVVIIDSNSINLTNVNVSNYDFVLFANPNFSIRKTEIELGISELEKSRVNIIQWSLRDINYIESNRYTYQNYREIFSTILIPTKNLVNEIELDSYFKNTTFIKKKAYISSKYIGNDLKNKNYKKDLIDFTIAFLRFNSFDDIKNTFESEIDLIQFLDFVIDNQVFEKLINKDKQIKIMHLINNKFKKFNDLRRRENTSLYLFYGLINSEYYEEALTSLMLYRSRRYWYHVEQDMRKELKNSVYDVRSTVAWKKTQKFRNGRLKTRDFYYMIEKHILKFLSEIYKLVSKKQIWLISERRDSASDNSYFLFEYLSKKNNSIKPYYVIDENAKQARKKVEILGNTLMFGSLKHKLFMLIAKKYITSFTVEETMLPFDSFLYKKIYKKELLEKKIISIQHGMIIHNISPYLSKENYLIDYITANSVYEKDIIKDSLGYKDEEVLITGMSRHDNLINKSVKINETNEILFMPTWQRGLQNLTTSQFLDSNYYQKISEMLNNADFIKYLKTNNLRLNVLMHPQFEKYVQYLKSKTKEISFLSIDKVEIPEMIATSKFLITDFSSVAVDFLFQQKNVIFYQYNKYASHHVPSKQIKYSDIGQIVNDLNELVDALEEIKINEFKLLEKYQTSYEKLFEVKENICEKTINTINDLK